MDKTHRKEHDHYDHTNTHSPKHNTLNWTGNAYTMFWVWLQMKHQMTSLGRLSSTTSLVLLSSSWIKYISPLLFSFSENTWSGAQQNLKILTFGMLCDRVMLNKNKYFMRIKPKEWPLLISSRLIIILSPVYSSFTET